MQQEREDQRAQQDKQVQGSSNERSASAASDEPNTPQAAANLAGQATGAMEGAAQTASDKLQEAKEAMKGAYDRGEEARAPDTTTGTTSKEASRDKQGDIAAHTPSATMTTSTDELIAP
jgi:hypothetical protein